MTKKIAIIGTGNIGSAMADGILRSGIIPAENLFLTRKTIHKLEKYKLEGVNITSDNKKAIEAADFVIIAVKPKKIVQVIEQITPFLDEKKHIIASAVTGYSIEKIKNQIQKNIPVYRIMPNTAAAICESMTFIAGIGNNNIIDDEVVNLVKSFGDFLSIEEELM